ncbi:unnamed protein product, partial [Meganyctiphanes norvegica]
LARSRQLVLKTDERNSKIAITVQNKLRGYYIENAESEPHKLRNRKRPTETKKEEEAWERGEARDKMSSKSFTKEVIYDTDRVKYNIHVENTGEDTSKRNNDDDETLKTEEENWYVDQELRKLAIQEACRGIPRDLSYKHLMEDPKNKLGHMLIDDQRKVIYCYVPKVACTNWKRLWLILNGLSNTTDPLSIPMYLPHAMHGYMMLTNQRLGSKLLEHKLQTYTKFIFVRHPFERLLSAYRDKLENLGPKRKPYWKIAVNMMSKVRKNSHQVNADGRGLRFEEFVRFALANPEWFNDDHFTSYEDLCHPCAISYDFIGKYESLVDDAEHILRNIGAPPEMHFPPFMPWANTSDVINKYYGTLSEEQIMTLYKIYQRDFQLFQYD